MRWVKASWVLLAVALAATSGGAVAETLKLSCQLAVTRTSPISAEENFTENVIAEIEQFRDGTTDFMVIGKEIQFGVSNGKRAGVTEITDNSDAGEWDLSNVFHSKNGDWLYYLKIDRNAGTLYLSESRQDAPGIIVSASGPCKKIDTKVRKF